MLDPHGAALRRRLGLWLGDGRRFHHVLTQTFEGHGTRQIEKTFRQGGTDFTKIGQAIGDSIGTDITPPPSRR